MASAPGTTTSSAAVSFNRLSSLVFAVTVCSLCLLPATSARAQNTLIDFQIPRITDIPIIDGNIGELEWAAATSIQVNIETEPGENIPAPVQTQALVMEDGEI